MSNVTVFEELIGKTVADVKVVKGEEYDFIRLTFDDGYRAEMQHSQVCCESVYIYDIIGDIEALIGAPLLQFEEVVSDGGEMPYMEDCYGSETWTFYKLASIKGSVTIRWYGTSNGYYSESVDVHIWREH